MRVLTGKRAELRSLAFSPDGTRLAAGGGRGVVQVWGRDGGQIDSRFGVGDTAVRFLSWLGPSRLLGVTVTRAILTFDLLRQEWGRLELPIAERYVWEVGVSPDGQLLCVTSSPVVALYDLGGAGSLWRVRIAVEGPNGSPSAVGWSEDGRALAVGLQNGQVKVLAAADGAVAGTLGEAGGPTVRPVALSPDHRAAAWCAGRHLHFCRGGVRAHHALGATHFLGVAWHPSGGFFATANGDGTVDYWDARTGERRESFAWGVGKLNGVTFDLAGDRAACCSATGQVVVWDVDR